MNKSTRNITRKNIVALLMSFVLLLSSVCYAGTGVRATEDAPTGTDVTEENTVTNETENIYTGEGYQVQFKLDNKWDTGYNATVTIKNTGDTTIENWCVSFPLEQSIGNIWNAVIEDEHEDFYVVKNAGWNQDIPAGGSISFGMTVYEAFTEFPGYYTMLGKEIELSDEDYTLDYVITEDWGDGYKAEITITNNKDETLEDWRLSFYYGDNLITQIWNAEILACIDGRVEIGCESYNQNIPSNGSVTFGFMVEPGCSASDISSILLFEYSSEHEDEEGKEENDGRYLSLMGIEDNQKDELGLIMASTDEYERYDIYVSTDDSEFEFLAETEKDIYTMPLSGEYTYKEFYVYGYIEDGTKVKSNYFSVEATEDGFVAVLPDTDGDGLEDAFEYICGSDIYFVDSDGDTLDDYYEVVVSGTSPIVPDTDEDEIVDPDEDIDEDGLTTSEEKSCGTNPLEADIDEDDLLDGDEVLVYGTDPYIPDTDEDGLLDGDEIVLGTEPLNPDTDGDGILDGDEKFQQTYVYTVENDCAIKEVKVTMEATGNVWKTTTVESVMNRDVMCTGVVGLIGEPFNIETTSEFDKATITYVLDTDSLGDTQLSDLLFLWYDEENHRFFELETFFDEESSSVSIETTHFSRYMIVNRYDWFAAWTNDISYNPGLNVSGPAVYQYNTVLAIDCSASMEWVDKIRYKNVNNGVDAQYPLTCGRIEAAMNFIKTMSAIDQAAVIAFDARAYVKCGLTSDKDTLKQATQRLIDSGDTNYYIVLKESLEQFTVFEADNPTVRNRIIFMSDGAATVPDSIIEELSGKKVQVYVVCFGGEPCDDTMQKLAECTRGEFFIAYSAEELTDIYKEIGVSEDFDTTDSDGDGLYDAIEVSGIRLENGSIIYTDPTL
ncbi:MAG: cellulose binding domain-containing protein, partial [Lachnospiraceae bacterium]|nr:cellulose binding domain-containing protein [Lachnospiraceae bacterium]